MHITVALFLAFFNVTALIQHGEAEMATSPWKTYGYIAVGSIVLIIVVIILIRKQHRKFNE